jgi:glutathione S-transferase
MPQELAQRRRALHLIGFALAASEKTVQIVYERNLRPAEKQHEPWVDRVSGQLSSAYALLEREVGSAGGAGWLTGERLMQADITVAVAWRFTQHILPGAVDPALHPALAAFSERAEALAEFAAAPLD